MATETLLIGSYAEPGLHIAARCGDEWRVTGAMPGTRKASFGIWSPRHRKLYLVREDEAGAIDVVAPDEDWRHLARIPTGGALPCHLALDHFETVLAVANYGSGDIAVFALHPDNGLPMPSPWLHPGHGSGPNKERQKGPHAHWVGFSPDGQWLLQCDLGTDQVLAFPLNGAANPGEPRIAFAAPAGSGPRWIFSVSGNRALLVSELASTLTMAEWNGGELREMACSSTRPAGARGDNLAGHIALTRDDTRAYVTNRGDDSIAVLAIAGEELRLEGAVPSGGKSPRFLLLADDEQTLFVGHEEQGPVTIFAVRGADLGPAGEIPVEKAAWLSSCPIS